MQKIVRGHGSESLERGCIEEVLSKALFEDMKKYNKLVSESLDRSNGEFSQQEEKIRQLFEKQKKLFEQLKPIFESHILIGLEIKHLKDLGDRTSRKITSLEKQQEVLNIGINTSMEKVVEVTSQLQKLCEELVSLVDEAEKAEVLQYDESYEFAKKFREDVVKLMEEYKRLFLLLSYKASEKVIKQSKKWQNRFENLITVFDANRREVNMLQGKKNELRKLLSKSGDLKGNRLVLETEYEMYDDQEKTLNIECEALVNGIKKIIVKLQSVLRNRMKAIPCV